MAESQETAQKKPYKNSKKLLNVVQFNSWCLSVRAYQGSTYVGQYNGTISKLNENLELNTSFKIEGLVGGVFGMTMDKEIIYSLVGTQPEQVYAHDLDGKLIAQWTHTDIDSENKSNQLAVIGDQVIIADRKAKELVIYSLTGDVLKRVPCAQISVNIVTLCVAGDDSIIIGNMELSRVFRINITTGEVMWTSEKIGYPRGVTCYEGRVVVFSIDRRKILVLDLSTGETVSEMADEAFDCLSGAFDLHTSGKTLIVAIPAKISTVRYYQVDW